MKSRTMRFPKAIFSHRLHFNQFKSLRYFGGSQFISILPSVLQSVATESACPKINYATVKTTATTVQMKKVQTVQRYEFVYKHVKLSLTNSTDVNGRSFPKCYSRVQHHSKVNLKLRHSK